MKDYLVIGILVIWAAMISLLTSKRSRKRIENENDQDEGWR
jgi:Tfp pilus assembly protein PilW